MSFQPTTKTRQTIRALPSPTPLTLIGFMVAVITDHSNGPLIAVALAVAIYNIVWAAANDAFDPDCENPEHQHHDCPACGDLPPLAPARSVFQRITRKVTSR